MEKNKKIDYEKIGQRIRRAREDRKLTQTELGNKLTTQMTATAISLYEKGEREISLKVLAEIADILNVSLHFLTWGEEEDQNPSVKTALRADRELSPKARDQIMDYIEFIKKKPE
jgi:repressor LexA